MNSPYFKNILGQTFGRLTVIGRAPNDKHGDTYWFVKCSCGNPKEQRVKGYALRAGLSKSCNCLHHEEMSKRLSLPPGECAFNQCLNNYKHQARKRNLPFKLTKEEFRELTQGACHYCGDGPTQEIIVPSNNGSYKYNGIDRLNSDLGYTRDNCVSACGLHNLMKLDMTVEQFLEACRKVTKHQEETHDAPTSHGYCCR